MQTTNAAQTTPDRPLTIRDLRNAIKAIGDLDTIGEWMRSQGFDPKEGCYLVLPELLAKEFEYRPPAYVKFSRLAPQPFLIRGDGLPTN